MKTKNTGVFSTEKQLKDVSDSYNLAFNTPAMAILPGGKVPTPDEDFRDMANRFAVEAGLQQGDYGIDPESREFLQIL